MYQNFIIPYLYEAQHVSCDTPPIIRSLKLHWQPLAFHTWRVVRRVAIGRCQAQYVPNNVHVRTCNVTLHVQTCPGRNRIIPLMRRPNTDSTPNKPITLPCNQLLIRYAVTSPVHTVTIQCYDTR
jgi:hypothetical protein